MSKVKEKGGQREETKKKEDKRTTWNRREMTNYEADACALTLSDAGQNSVSPVLVFTFSTPTRQHKNQAQDIL